MRQAFITRLDDRAVIRILGPDSKDFLQGLITFDMADAGPGAWGYAGLLTPQGKILFDFFVLPDGDGYVIDCAAVRHQALAQRLALYKLRANVEIQSGVDLTPAAIWSTGTEDLPITNTNGALCARDARAPGAGLRCALGLEGIEEFATQNNLTLVTRADYDRHRLALGLPGVEDIGEGEHFVHECNFDRLGGVSFSKGCYIGQEVVSRVEHRGSARKRMLPVTFDGTPPAFGTDIVTGGRAIGTLLSSSGNLAMALIRLDLMDKAEQAGEPLLADGVTIKPAPPAWADFAAGA